MVRNFGLMRWCITRGGFIFHFFQHQRSLATRRWCWAESTRLTPGNTLACRPRLIRSTSPTPPAPIVDRGPAWLSPGFSVTFLRGRPCVFRTFLDTETSSKASLRAQPRGSRAARARGVLRAHLLQLARYLDSPYVGDVQALCNIHPHRILVQYRVQYI